MNKEQFLNRLYEGLKCLQWKDVEQSVDFYREMIDDRMEEGLGEEEAVRSVGDPDEIIAKIISETQPRPSENEGVKSPKMNKTWTIALIILGFPLWIPLLAAAAAVIIAIYVSIWSVIISLYAVTFSSAAMIFGCAVIAVKFFFVGSIIEGIFYIGCSIFSAGLSILLFFGSDALARALIFLSRKLLHCIKKPFKRKEQKQ